MEKIIKTVEIHDKVFEETYTAHIQKNGTSWLGWIPDVPKVKCEEQMEKTLLKTLENRLHEALVAEEEAWEQQFEADVAAGKLDRLCEEALADVRAGRFKYLKLSVEEQQVLLSQQAEQMKAHYGQTADERTEWQAADFRV